MKTRLYDSKSAQDMSQISAKKLLQTRPFQAESNTTQQPPQPLDESASHNKGFDLTKTQAFVTGESSHPMQGLPLQAKLTIGQPNDRYEQEADHVAHEVVQRLNRFQIEPPQSEQAVKRESSPGKDAKFQIRPLASQVQHAEMPEEDKELQMSSMLQPDLGKETIPTNTELENSIQQSCGSGQSLAANIRQPLEQAFGNVDFSGVKVHTDAQADQLNRTIQAKAFTTGNDIFFRQRSYAPTSQEGIELIAHELTHVLQQKSGEQQATHIQNREHDNHSITVNKGQWSSDKSVNGSRHAETKQILDWRENEHSLMPLEQMPVLPSFNTTPAVAMQLETFIQCNWDDVPLNYSAMQNEKRGKFKTGRLKLNSLKDWIEKFKKALINDDEKGVVKALEGLMKSLIKDKKSPVKKPNKASIEELKKWNKTTAKSDAANFYDKWIKATQDHLDHIQKGGDWLTDFKKFYQDSDSPLSLDNPSNSLVVDEKEHKTTKESKSEKSVDSENEAELSKLEKKSGQSKLDFNNPPWETATKAEVISSGHGGVAVLTFKVGKKIEKLVVKGSGGLSDREVLASRLANYAGLRVPETRKANSGEPERIKSALTKYGVKMPNKEPTLVMKYVKGMTLGKLKDAGFTLKKDDVLVLSKSIGNWFAFDVMIREQDRFGKLSSGIDSINSSNFLVDPDNLKTGFVGIDQIAMATEGKAIPKAIEAIKAGEDYYFLGLALLVKKQLNASNCNEDDIMDKIIEGAQETMKGISKGLTEKDLETLIGNLKVDKEVLDSILEYTQKIL
ncbi:MAG: DUF4157 domain-containing protein [Cyanobacteria bacterium J06639_16]